MRTQILQTSEQGQGAVFSPILYLSHINEIYVIQNATISTLADDTAILTVSETFNSATQ